MTKESKTKVSVAISGFVVLAALVLWDWFEVGKKIPPSILDPIVITLILLEVLMCASGLVQWLCRRRKRDA